MAEKQTSADLRKIIIDTIKPQRFAFVGYAFNNEAFEEFLKAADYVFDRAPKLIEVECFGVCFDQNKRGAGILIDTDYIFIEKKNLELNCDFAVFGGKFYRI